MKADKGLVERLAEPVAYFRMDPEVPHGFAVASVIVLTGERV